MNKICKTEYYKRGFRFGYRFGYNFQKAIDGVPDREKKNFQAGYDQGCLWYAEETEKTMGGEK